MTNGLYDPVFTACASHSHCAAAVVVPSPAVLSVLDIIVELTGGLQGVCCASALAGLPVGRWVGA